MHGSFKSCPVPILASLHGILRFIQVHLALFRFISLHGSFKSCSVPILASLHGILKLIQVYSALLRFISYRFIQIYFYVLLRFIQVILFRYISFHGLLRSCSISVLAFLARFLWCHVAFNTLLFRFNVLCVVFFLFVLLPYTIPYTVQIFFLLFFSFRLICDFLVIQYPHFLFCYI